LYVLLGLAIQETPYDREQRELSVFADKCFITVLGTMHEYNFGLCPGQDSADFAGVYPLGDGASERTLTDVVGSPGVMVVEPESSETFSTSRSAPNVASQNVQFMDANPAFDYTVDGTDDPTRGCADSSDATLGSFLERPILIGEFSWAPGVAFSQSFDPWSLFYNDSRNVNRLANFNLLRSRLCVKFVINGNGFYYGRLLASYNPLPDYDQVTVNRGLTVTADAVGASQRPHIYINPTECQGGTLCIPFVHYQNTLRVPEAQWAEMGVVDVRQLNPLKNVNAAPGVVGQELTLSVFAWAENVELSVPTASNPVTIVPQCLEVSPESDEYGDTPVSAVASAIARVSGKLTSVPFIGRFAKATQIGARAVGDVGKLFGFSRPPIIDPIQTYVPRYVGGLANVNTPDAVQKLSLDVKQEVTIDPSVVGVSSADEMGLVDIAKRESYYATFVWSTTGYPNSGPGSKLFQTQVMPTVFRTFGSGAATEYHNMPCGMMALPFKYWGGSMEFRFQIVSSNFHRGRLRIVWDPHSLTGGGSSSGYNTMYTRIVDIADMRDFTFKVGWGREYSFLPVHNPMQLVDGLPVPSFSTGSGAPAVLQQVFGNGTISVFVVNDLTTPSPDPSIDASVEVNVFVKMCDDARFAEPTDAALANISYFPSEVPTVPQSLEVVPESDETTAEVQLSAPVSTEVTTDVGASGDPTDHTMDVFFGEQVTSIRELLKRYCFHSSTLTANGDFPTTCKYTIPDFPFYYGYNPDGPDTSTEGPFAYAHMTMLNYFTPAFVAYRGAVRWKHWVSRVPIQVTGENAVQGSFDVPMVVERKSGLTTSLVSPTIYEPYSFSIVDSVLRAGLSLRRAVLASYPSLYNGGLATPVDVNPDGEVELPFYTNRRFYNARRIRTLATRAINDELPGVHTITTSGQRGVLFNYVAAGEDFSLSFFIGVPIMYSIGHGSPNPVPLPA